MIDICCIGHITHDRVITPHSDVHMPGGTSFYFTHGISHLLQGNVSYKLITSLAEEDMQAVRDILSERGDSISWRKLDLENNYLVGINLEEALKNPGSDADILLREGDRIFVPEYDPIVKISGDVFFPNTVFFEKNKGYKHYVEMAGGFGNRAKKSKTFIVYQNGTVGLPKKGAKPEPGCEIVVPSKKRRNPLNLASS